MKHPAAKQIIARYSALRITAWIAGTDPVCVWILASGAARGWSLPEGRYGLLFPVAVVGAALGLLLSLAMVLTFVLARGVAIAKIGDDFVFNYLLSRRWVPARHGVTICATPAVVDVPVAKANLFFKTPPLVVSQIAVQRSGQADLTFRTGLLRESAAAIAERMSALIA